MNPAEEAAIQLHTSHLYRRWILANSLGELLGLGATFAIGFFFFVTFGEPRQPALIIAFLLLSVATGAVEGIIVGLSQWVAMRPWFPGLERRTWISATVIGALIAWFLGSLPSALMALFTGSEDPPPTEPPFVITLLLAAGLGAAAGVVLALPQTVVLGRHVSPGWWWLPANAMAWLVGMPVIFAAIDAVQRRPSAGAIILFMGGGLALAGAVVGSIHGAVLARLVRNRAAT